MANVVEANLRTVEPADQCLEVDIQRLKTDEHAVVAGENHVVHIVPMMNLRADAAGSASLWLTSMRPSQMARDESCALCGFSAK